MCASGTGNATGIGPGGNGRRPVWPGACLLWMLAQPRRQRGGGAIRQHVGDGSGLKIHEDGSPCGASAPSPLINANNPQCPTPALSLRPTLEMPKNRIAAHHNTKPGEQPARGFASSAVAHHRQNIDDGVALLRVASGETGQSFREDRALAGRRCAPPFSDPEPYDDRDALH
jgi:hypothetical protein